MPPATYRKVAREPQTIAQEGVGRPRKSSVWRSSTLNFANRTADITATNSGMYRRMAGASAGMTLYSIKDGRTPKLTRSARESSSPPMGECASRSRAARPSQKSKAAARSISGRAHSRRPSKVKITPMTPERRFMEVIVLGMCL